MVLLFLCGQSQFFTNDLTRFPWNHCSLTEYYIVKNTEQGSARVFMKTMELHFSKYNIYMRFLLTYILSKS